MPTIPSVNSIQRRQGPTGSAIVRPAGNPAVDAMDGVSRKLGDDIERISRDELAKATNKFLVLKAEQDNAFDNDPDYGSIPDRYTTRIQEGIGLLSREISDPAAREMFQSEMSVHLAQGREKMIDLSRQKHREKEIGDITNEADILLKESIRPGSDIAFTANAMDMRIQAAADNGILNQDDAQQLKIKFRDNVALSKLTAMSPQDRLEVFKESPQWLNNIDAGTQSRLKKEAQSQARLSDAQQAADYAMRENMTRTEANRYFFDKFQSKDPELYSDAVTQFGLRYQSKKADDAERATELFNDYADGVIDGTWGTAEIMTENPDDWYDMSPAAQQNLINWEQQRAGGKMRQHSDRGVVFELMRLSKGGKNTWPDFLQYFSEHSSQLNQADFKTWADIATGDNTSLLSAQELLSAATRNMTNDRQITQVYTRVNDWHTDQRNRNGVAPTGDEISKKIGFEVSAVLGTGGWFTGDQLPGDLNDIEDLAEAIANSDTETASMLIDGVIDDETRVEAVVRAAEIRSPMDIQDLKSGLMRYYKIDWDILNYRQRHYFLQKYRQLQGDSNGAQ